MAGNNTGNNKNNPLVSVIIPHYNRPEKLRRAVDSVLRQTHQNFEVIIVDDNSKPESKPKKISDSRVHIHYSISNQGPGISRNSGLSLSIGQYVAFLDSDDFWEDRFLENMLGIFEAGPDLAMAYAQTQVFDDKGNTRLRRGRKSRVTHILPSVLFIGRSWCTSACVWNRRILPTDPWIDSNTWEDYAFDVSVAVKNNKIGYSKEILVHYDGGGDDKLSKNITIEFEKERLKSVAQIASSIRNSLFYSDSALQKRVVLLFLRDIKKLIRDGDKMAVKDNLDALQNFVKWPEISLTRILATSNNALLQKIVLAILPIFINRLNNTKVVKNNSF